MQNQNTDLNSRPVRTPRQPRPRKPREPIKIIPLGGLNEIGKNMTVYQCRNDMFIVDCGSTFPESEMFGIDLVIPDFTFVEENKENIKGIVITHGHEDHIGALPYLLKKVNIPVLRHKAYKRPY